MAAQQVPAGVRPLLLYNILLYMRSVVCREYDCTTVLQGVFTTVECNGSLVVPVMIRGCRFDARLTGVQRTLLVDGSLVNTYMTCILYTTRMTWLSTGGWGNSC